MKEPNVKQRTKYNKCLVKMMEGLSKRNDTCKEQLASILMLSQMMLKSDPASDLAWKESASMLLGMEGAISKKDFQAIASGKDSMPKLMQPLLGAYATFSDGAKTFMWKKLDKLCKIIRGLPSAKDASKKKIGSSVKDANVSKEIAAASVGNATKEKGERAPTLSALQGVPLLQSRIAPVLRPFIRDPHFKNIKQAITMLQKGMESGSLKLPDGGDMDPSKMTLSEKDITDPKELEVFRSLGLGAFMSGAAGGGGGAGNTGETGGIASTLGGLFGANSQSIMGAVAAMTQEIGKLKDEDRDKTEGPVAGGALAPQAQQIKENLEKITLLKHFHAVLMAILIEITGKRGKAYPVLIHCFYKLRWFIVSGGYVPDDNTKLDDPEGKVVVTTEQHDPLLVLRATVDFYKRHGKAFQERDSSMFLNAPDEPVFKMVKMAALWSSFSKSSQKLLWQWADHLKSIAFAARLTGGRLAGFETMAKEMLPEIFNKYSELGGLNTGGGGLEDLLKNPGKIGEFLGDFTKILKKNNRLYDVRDLVRGLMQKDELNKACDLFHEFTSSAENAAAEQEQEEAAKESTTTAPPSGQPFSGGGGSGGR